MQPTATPPAADALARVLDRLSALAIGIAAASLAGLVVVQGWQVFARYVLNDSPSWTEPVTLLLLSTAMAMGAATGVRENRHFGFFLLADALGPRGHRLVEALGGLVVAAIGAVLAGWSAALLADGWDVHLAGAPLPQSINYLPLSLGGALMAAFALDRLRRRPASAGGAR
ncbi:TRAP transporter small permease [Vulcaniibacterium tengchongense]|uniref:TRAP transporter small permease protein n=1 Tax=Vulcaniibacterium tengchongense TaxID=1273429 RepID=A0A3N4UYY3_9GAMM|nr:TRAP transporter small permease [Vulcaniibacterium tengchongense]RPE75926.1 TRAP-type C4-dicarboxylate transport system permease small subunit [Vulcaniibacterium tengchongense]